MLCPLCSKNDQTVLSRANQKIYYVCPQCDFVYLDRQFYLSRQEERERYAKHENNPDDPKYQKFLQPVLDSLLPYLKDNSLGLDFGSGAGSPLHHMFAASGHKVKNYDPFFYPEQTVFKHKYDFIVSTETFEHLYQPMKEMKLLLTCLKPGGYICVMTQFLNNKDNFESWYYHRDPSHVGFFNQHSFQYLAKALGLIVYFPHKSIALFGVK